MVAHFELEVFSFSHEVQHGGLVFRVQPYTLSQPLSPI